MENNSIAKDTTELIGKTPLVYLNKVVRWMHGLNCSEIRVNGTLFQFQGHALSETMSLNIRSCDTRVYMQRGGSTNPTQGTKGAVEKAEEIMANTPKLVNPNVSLPPVP
ncbi:hypothetical protein V6N11_079633 [Hibiscus sabdariffa]|uniref:Uncharacterized protein n=1 Tax=Hibiscus sabdariffa TaxID=183260 RepID=A0ABR2RWC0_9ROSI